MVGFAKSGFVGRGSPAQPQLKHPIRKRCAACPAAFYSHF